MFKRKYWWFGRLVSDEGFEIFYAHKTVCYRDRRGDFQFGYEDGMLNAKPYQAKGEKLTLSQLDIDQMVDRVIRGLKADGLPVELVFGRGSTQVPERHLADDHSPG
jgi:hypothetical protein